MRELRDGIRRALCAAVALAAAASASAAELTILHNNDGESTLLGSPVRPTPPAANTGFGGIDFFAPMLAVQKAAATAAGRDVITLSSGDNFLAGVAFAASQRAGTYYDALAMAALDYDVIQLGNHDFDFGPDVLADVIDQYRASGGKGIFIAANLSVAGEPALQPLEASGVIAKSRIIERGAEAYGVIGVITETLPTISSPRGATVSSVVAAVQQEVAALEAQGINKIILSSHLQGISNELALVPQLRGVDVVIAGGGDEFLINPGTGGDRYSDTLDGVNDAPDNGFERRVGPYPLVAVDSDGVTVPIVTTIGEYRYVGRLDVSFDAAGNVVAFSGNPVLVDPTAPATAPDPNLVPTITSTIVDPLLTAQAALGTNIVATTQVPLSGLRGSVTTSGGVPFAVQPGVRNRDTNLGNVVADAFLWQAENTVGAPNGLTPGRRRIALTNGGGIRNTAIVAPAATVAAPGNVSELDTVNTLPFANYVSVVQGVSAVGLKEMLENGVSRWANGDGRFPQVSGIRFEWDPKRQPTVFANAQLTMDAVTTPGSRIRRIEFDDGTVVYDAATNTFFPDPIDVVTNSFTAEGGDGYDFGGNNQNAVAGNPLLGRVNLPYSYQQALFNYLLFGLPGGVVTAAEYPVGGERRIYVRYDVDGDGDIDQSDVNAVTLSRGATPTVRDPRDANVDGRIDVLDARLVAVNCSRPRCAL